MFERGVISQEHHLQCSKFGWDFVRNIDVTNDEVNEVDKGIDGAKATGAISNHSDDAIHPFCGSIGYMRIHEGDYFFAMLAKRVNEFPDGFESTFQCGGSPLF